MGVKILHLAVAFAFATLVDNVISSDISSIKMENGDPHIQLSYGDLSGTVKESRNGRSYYSFMGVRYANVPNRFERAAVYDQSWEGVNAANVYGAKCPQGSWADPNEIIGNEDCLFCNINVPVGSLSEQNSLPVIVWIHGGGFSGGEGDSYGPDYFMDQDVIIVTINYRLGALGFLSTEDGVAPGNNGLHDQVVALQWVQKNIGAFGGDPNRVTIFGESAGSASVQYLLLSPLAKGLFQNAISASGSALDPWARTVHPLERAKQLGKLLNCPISSSIELVHCLKKQTAADILLHSKTLLKWSVDPIGLFAPTVEKTNKKDAVLPDTPESLIETGKYNRVPLIIGVTEKEGVMVQAGVILNSEKLTRDLNEEWNTYAPITFSYEDRFKKEDLFMISDKIRNFYFGDQPIEESTRDNLTNLYSDVNFIYGTRKTALAMSKHAPVYLYMYSYRSPFSLATLLGINEFYGTTHADDLQTYFKVEVWGRPVEKDSPSYAFSENYVKLLVSFASEGKPTKTWDQVNKWDSINRKHIENGKPLSWFNIDEKTKILEEPNDMTKRMKFWDELLRDYSHENSHRDEL